MINITRERNKGMKREKKLRGGEEEWGWEILVGRVAIGEEREGADSWEGSKKTKREGTELL